jgi:hypothetical protein
MVVAMTVCSPTSTDALLITGMLLVASLGTLLQPQDNFESVVRSRSVAAVMALWHIGSGSGSALRESIHMDDEDDEEGQSQQLMAHYSVMASLASQYTLLKAGLFLSAIAHIMMRIPLDTYACKTQFVLLLACLDAFMLFGHLWDKVPTLQVVLNCRLVYICCLCFYNAVLFVSWQPCASVLYYNNMQQWVKPETWAAGGR